MDIRRVGRGGGTHNTSNENYNSGVLCKLNLFASSTEFF